MRGCNVSALTLAFHALASLGLLGVEMCIFHCRTLRLISCAVALNVIMGMHEIRDRSSRLSFHSTSPPYAAVYSLPILTLPSSAICFSFQFLQLKPTAQTRASKFRAFAHVQYYPVLDFQLCDDSAERYLTFLP